MSTATPRSARFAVQVRQDGGIRDVPMSLEAVVGELENRRVNYSLIGAVALASRGVARSTLDLDLLTTDKSVLDSEFWSQFRSKGHVVEIRKGDFDDPLAGVIRVAGEEPIDIVVGKYKWQRDIVDRADMVTVRGLRLRVARAADLILLKLFAGGYQDLADILRLLHATERASIVPEVEALLEDLPVEMRDRWQQLLHAG